MINKKKILSIVVATYNINKSIKSTLDSIIEDMDERSELIVVDGGSEDGTWEIIKNYRNSITYCISERDNGIYSAWNKGIANSSGEYIVFIGGDDILLRNTLGTYIDYIHRNKNYDFISSKVYFGDPSKNIVIGKALRWPEFKRFMSIAHVGSVHKRSMFDNYGFFDENYKIAGDYEFLLRLGPKINAGFIDFISLIMGDSGVSNTLKILALKETYLAKLTNGNCNSLVVKIEYYIAILKIIIHRISKL